MFLIRPTVPEYLGIFSSILPQHKKWLKVKIIWLDLTGDYESFDRLSGSIFVEKHKTIAFFLHLDMIFGLIQGKKIRFFGFENHLSITS